MSPPGSSSWPCCRSSAQFQQRIGWHSLMVSRHVTWMVPVTAPLVIVPLAVILVGPALALLAWRSRRGRPASPAGCGVGLGLGGNGPGHALASRTIPRRSRNSPGGGVRLGARPRFSTLARDGSPDSRLASPLLRGRGNRDPGTAGLPICAVERGRPLRRSQPGTGPSPAQPICFGLFWTR